MDWKGLKRCSFKPDSSIRREAPSTTRTRLLEPSLIYKVQAYQSVLLAQRHRRPAGAESPLHLDHQRIGAGHIGDVSEGDLRRHLLFDGQPRLWVILHSGQSRQGRIDLQAGDAEEALQAAGDRTGDGLAQQG